MAGVPPIQVGMAGAKAGATEDSVTPPLGPKGAETPPTREEGAETPPLRSRAEALPSFEPERA